MKKVIAGLLLIGLFLAGPAARGLWAQSAQMPPPAADAQDVLHLNTIGAFSAGFVIQSYGYIGVLADALSKDVYEPELVRSMLSETVSYLRNVNTQLQKYQSATLIASGDKKFIATMMEIINQLIAEAEALSSFAQSKSKEDLARYESARGDAWKNIKNTFGMN